MGGITLNRRERLTAIEADISGLAVEAIMNAANEPLIMGSGVDGAIRRKAGPEMEADLRRIGRCPSGEAVLTRGYALAARFVIHTVAPIWSADTATRENAIRVLSNCYRNCIAVARANGISEIAFPCLGTGVYGWPADLAAETAFRTVCESLEKHSAIAHVIFCCFGYADLERYGTLIARSRC
jgi:O-acetyl-ADP-ribose deacetylase (regulator of RNase III)